MQRRSFTEYGVSRRIPTKQLNTPLRLLDLYLILVGFCVRIWEAQLCSQHAAFSEVYHTSEERFLLDFFYYCIYYAYFQLQKSRIFSRKAS